MSRKSNTGRAQENKNTKERASSSYESVLDNIEESINRTKSVIISSLETLTLSGDLCIDFITKERIARPPFPFIHALVVIYNQHLLFAQGLYSEFDLDLKNISTKQERIKFLFKIFVCVAMISGVRVDIYVSPAKVLGGQEVTASHLFLRCLANASKVPSEQSIQVAEQIIKIGESTLYKQSVKSRNMIIRVQAMIRGWLTRKGSWYGHRSYSSNEEEEATSTTTKLKSNNNEKFQKEEKTIKEGEFEGKLNVKAASVKVTKKSGGGPFAIIIKPPAAEQVKNKESVKGQADDDKCIAPCEARINELEGSVSNIIMDDDGQHCMRSSVTTSTTSNCQRNVKKQKIRHVLDGEGPRKLKNVHRQNKRSSDDDIDHSFKQNFEDKLEKKCQNDAPRGFSKKTTKVIKKFVISNGVITQQTKEVYEHVLEDDNDEDNKLKVISEREVELNKKWNRLKDREAKLKIRIEETKQKEMQLELNENRVQRLADILRKQQDKMKEDAARRNIEIDELRLQTISNNSSNNTRMPTNRCFNKQAMISFPNEFHFSDEILRQACYNPTITDLRLGLERKERQLRTRHANLLRAEKDLQSRIIDFERRCCTATSQETAPKSPANNELPEGRDSKMHSSLFSRETIKQKVKKNIEETAKLASESSIPGCSNVAPDNTVHRRDAFVPATLPNELKARTSAPKKRKEGSDQSSVSKHATTSISNNSIPVLSSSEEKQSIQLSRRQSLPRSLIDYTNSHA